MICPKCQNTEIDPSGVCLVCGYPTDTAAQDSPGAKQRKKDVPPQANLSGLIEMSYSHAPADSAAAVPEWRQELSRRLQELKQKQRVGPGSSGLLEGIRPLPFPESKGPEPDVEVEPPTSTPPRSESAERKFQRKPAKKAEKEPRSELPLFGMANARKTESLQPAAETEDIRRLIDRAVAQEAASETADHDPVIPAEPSYDSRPLLLSRTLSGLIDLLLISCCTGVFIVSADVFSGVSIIDRFSLVNYGTLLMAVYLLYSLFFLITAGQTVGMMITDLRVVSFEGGRPSGREVLLRCLGYLASLVTLGIGLAWGYFDREGHCLHDRFSGTEVIRL
jgi:uncharacterized RDD family membrane protein YckC